MIDIPESLDSIKAKIEEYPFPIAAVVRTCRNIDRGDWSTRHLKLRDLAESFIKFNCILALQEVRRMGVDLRTRLPQGEESLLFLRQPSLGNWVVLLRQLAGFPKQGVSSPFLDALSTWYRNPSLDGEKCLRLFEQFPQINYLKGADTPHAEMLNALVTYRNRIWGHGVSDVSTITQPHTPVLENILGYLLLSASFLCDVRLLFTRKIELIEPKKWRVVVDVLTGSREEPNEIVCSVERSPRELYVSYGAQSDGLSEAMPISPFLLYQYNEQAKRNDILFHNAIMRTLIEYQSPVTGWYYHHRQLHADFEKILHLHPFERTGTGEFDYTMPQEQRAKNADKHAGVALALHAKGQTERAAQELEAAIVYDRRANFFFTLASYMRELGDPSERVIYTLQQCLEMDPKSIEARSLLQSIDLSIPALAIEDSLQKSVATDGLGSAMTIYHALTPHYFRQFAGLWLTSFILIWYSMSVFLERAYGDPSNILPVILQGTVAFLLSVPLTILLPMFQRLREPLRQQLETSRMWIFDALFELFTHRIFGTFVLEGKKVHLMASIRSQPWFYLSGVAWTLALSGHAFFVGYLGRDGALISIKRFLDLMPIFATLFIATRYSCLQIYFIYEFSKESIKPAFTRIADDGLRALGPIVTLSTLAASGAYLAFWIMSLLVLRGDRGLDFLGVKSHYVDFLGIVINSACMIVWTVGLPLILRRTMRQSRAQSIYKYSGKIEDSFRSFIDDPSDDTLARYQWLVVHQSVIGRLPIWPFSLSATLFGVIGGNLVMLVRDVCYVLIRLGYIPKWSVW